MTTPVDDRSAENPTGDLLDEAESIDEKRGVLLEREAVEAASKALHALFAELRPDAAQTERFEACAERLLVAAAEYGHATAFAQVRKANFALHEELDDGKEAIGARAARFAAGAAGVKARGMTATELEFVVPFLKRLNDEESEDWQAVFERVLRRDYHLSCIHHRGAFDLRVTLGDEASALVIGSCCASVAKDVRRIGTDLKSLARSAGRAPQRVPSHGTPSAWIDNHCVQVLVPQRARGEWRGDEELPNDVRGRYDNYWSHFKYAHDRVARDGVRFVLLDSVEALIFGYDPAHTCWLPFEDLHGGSLVQLHAQHFNSGANAPFEEALSLAAKMRTREPTGEQYVAEQELHNLFPAGSSGADVGARSPFSHLEMRLIPGTYEVWTNRMPCARSSWEVIVYRFEPIRDDRT